MISICIGRFGLTLLEAERTTWREYKILQKAYMIRRNEQTALNAQLAFFNQSVQATTGSKKNPKPKYPHLKDFYDEEDIFWDIFRDKKEIKKKNKKMSLADINRLI